MKLTRWKALYFSHLLTFFLFSCICTSCRQKTADNTLSLDVTPNEEVILLDTAVALAIADSLYVLGEKYNGLKKNDSALRFHTKALEIRELNLTGDIRLFLSNLKIGGLYIDDGKYEVADKYLENARRIGEAEKIDAALMTDIYFRLTVCKREMKDFPTAISLVQRLLHFYKENDKASRAKVADAYNLLATIYHEQGQHSKAIETWAIAIHMTPPDDHQTLGKLYFNSSIASSAIKQFELSLAYINKSIQQDLMWAGPESETLARRYLYKGFALLDEKKPDSVKYFLAKTLKIREKIFGVKNSNTYGAKRSLGEYYSIIGQYDSAAFYHHQSLISLVKSFINADLFANPRPEINEINPDLVAGLVNKASAFENLFERDTSRFDLLRLSLKTYLLADSMFSVYRKSMLHDEAVMAQMENTAIPYSNILEIALKLFQASKSINYFDDALSIMERSRSIVLQNALARASALGTTGISDSLFTIENKLIQYRAQLLQLMNSPNLSRFALDSLNEELLLANNKAVDLQQLLKIENPNYFSARYESLLPTREQLQKVLRRQNSILIEYMWVEGIIYALLIGPDTIRFEAIPTTEVFRKALKKLEEEFHMNPEGAIGLERFKNFCHNSLFLYQTLLSDLLTNTPANAHLIISADGPLATIPFEVLMSADPGTDEVDYHLPYLITNHAVSYAYSAGVLIKQQEHEREGKKLIAFGYAGSGSSRQSRNLLSNLPGTEQEILSIKEVMKNDVNKYKLQDEASEFTFKQQVHEFDIVHLAVHGEGDTQNALNSRLIFRSEQDSVEDGSLYAHELYDMDLSQLDLAVLSACESGVGKRQTGEGVMSIARGFAYAGCPSLVISLWKIDDHTSAQVMKGFYNHLSEGDQLDDALAKAKTDYINGASEFNSHPYYWAAFLQVGDVRELDVKKPNWWGWIFGGVALLSLIFSLSQGSFLRKQ